MKNDAEYRRQQEELRRQQEELRVRELERQRELERERERAREKGHELAAQAATTRVLSLVKAEGITLDRFWLELLRSKEPTQSSWISRTLNAHGPEVMDAMVEKKPKLLEPWVKSKAADLCAPELQKLSKKLRLDQRKALTAAFNHLSQWQVMEDIQKHAPSFWEVLDKLRNLDEAGPSQPRAS